MQSMRLATRAVHNITRLSPKPARHAQAADQVFVAAPVAAGAALADSAPIEERSTPASLAVDNHACLYWSLAYVSRPDTSSELPYSSLTSYARFRSFSRASCALRSYTSCEAPRSRLASSPSRLSISQKTCTRALSS